MRACASMASTETVTSVAALSRGSFRWTGAILWSLNSLPLTVHVRTVVGAIHLARVRFAVACGGWIRARLRRRRSLRNDLLGKQDYSESDNVD
jgi:hypothetical protein